MKSIITTLNISLWRYCPNFREYKLIYKPKNTTDNDGRNIKFSV